MAFSFQHEFLHYIYLVLLEKSWILFISKMNSLSSTFIISVFLLLSVAKSSYGAECGPDGLCKYGGTCGPDNQCRCSMTCTSPEWKVDFNSMYCLPRNGARPHIFLNICFLMAEACERQEDVPLIKFDIRNGRCDGEKQKSERFCPTPQEFMGPCGGTLRTSTSQSYEGGVCLRKPESISIQCICPRSKTGERCEQRSLPSIQVNDTKECNKAKIIGVSIGASIGAGVLICALLRWACSKSKRVRNEAKREAILNGCDCRNKKTNREERELSCGKSIFGSDIEVSTTSKTGASPPTSAQSENSAASKSSQRRQRLTGSSLEDANNNSGSISSNSETNRTSLENSPKDTRSEHMNKENLKDNFNINGFDMV